MSALALFPLLAVASAGTVTVARAQTAAAQGGSEKVAAEALFEDGRKLVAAGKYAEACPKFADSQRLDPSPGTLLNLANCYEKLGRSATAWATYKQAASAANAAGRSDYVATAQRHAGTLAPRLAHLTVTVAQPTDGMKVTRDGVTVEHAEWGLPIPVDSGQHSIDASAPGRKAWATAVDVSQDGAQVTVTVPPLDALPADAAPAPAPVPAPALAPAPGAPVPALAPAPGGEEPSSGGGGTQRLLGVVVGGVGVAGLAVGGVFAAVAKGKYNDSLGHCQPSDANVCDSTGVSERNDAISAGNVATAAVIAGGVAVAGGVVLWLTAPRASSPASATALRLGIAPAPGGAVLHGAW